MRPRIIFAFPTKPGEAARNANAYTMGKMFGGRVFDEPGKPHEWFRSILDWALIAVEYSDDTSRPTHLCQLQDDVKFKSPGAFAGALGAIVTAYPNQPICLQSVHQAAALLYQAGSRGYTTTDGLIGVGWVLPLSLAREYRDWLDGPAKEYVSKISEDTLLGLWCTLTGRKIFHPLPTIIDHDTSIPSTYGNDAHANRRSPVRWDTVENNPPLKEPDFWHMANVPHLGMFYPSTTPRLASTIGKLSPKELAALKGDNGQGEMRILANLLRAHELKSNTQPTKIYLATPRRGPDSPHYTDSKCALIREEHLYFGGGAYETAALRHNVGDIVRVRSQFVRSFLEETDADALLFLDNDVAVSPQCVRGMVAALAKHPFVMAPYPRREGVSWERVRKVPNLPAEAIAYQYTVVFPDKMQSLILDDVHCAEVARAAIGCSLLRRDFLQDLTERFWEELTSWDKGTDGWLCFLFRLMRSDGEAPPAYEQRSARPLRPRLELSEDFSFCDRVRSVGYSPMLYLGPGSPADHEGDYLYKGHRGAFGL